MTQAFFITQMDRLKRRFGEKNFDAEFMRLASHEVSKMSEQAFQKAVDIWIGNRKTHDYPLIANFTEARLAEEKRELGLVAWQAAKAMTSGSVDKEGLKRILKEEFGGCLTVADAIEYTRMQNKIKA